MLGVGGLSLSRGSFSSELMWGLTDWAGDRYDSLNLPFTLACLGGGSTVRLGAETPRAGTWRGSLQFIGTKWGAFQVKPRPQGPCIVMEGAMDVPQPVPRLQSSEIRISPHSKQPQHIPLPQEPPNLPQGMGLAKSCHFRGELKALRRSQAQAFSLTIPHIQTDASQG